MNGSFVIVYSCSLPLQVGPSSKFLIDPSLVDLFCYFCVCLCHTVLSVSCSHVVTCWERADLLVLFYVMFSCVFVTFPYGVLGQVLYLIVSIPDLVFFLTLIGINASGKGKSAKGR